MRRDGGGAGSGKLPGVGRGKPPAGPVQVKTAPCFPEDTRNRHVDGNERPVAVEASARASTAPLSSALEPEFRKLARRWRQETAQISDVHEKVLHPAHLRIIGLGPDVLPLVFAELEQRPTLWFWALEALTGADPVPEGTSSMKAAREAWLAYGRQHGYL